ncbi:MAG: MotA/TolQ/ExbB proton channel family protein [Candidatus Omnitrophota bacterium]
MVTTATGLIIAIPAMIFYSYFRGKIQNITSQLENISTELFHLISDKI